MPQFGIMVNGIYPQVKIFGVSSHIQWWHKYSILFDHFLPKCKDEIGIYPVLKGYFFEYGANSIYLISHTFVLTKEAKMP